MTRQLHLGLFTYPAGHHIASWRHPKVNAREIASIDYYGRLARTAERGKFDLLFVGDMLAARERDGKVIREGGLNNIDSISILSAVSALTECLGFVATLSTTYNEPYTIAERFSSLDHISRGRAGWNVVTTSNDDAAYNFSRKSHMEKTLRYERAKEFVDICTALWDSWDDDAVADASRGVVADPAKIHPIDHQGRFFSVRGASRLPRPPQGWPVLVQAGGSPSGIEFAAMISEAIFAAQTKLEEARAFRSAVQERMPKYGRSRDAVKVLPGLSPILGSTEVEAKRKEAELDELIVPAVGVWMLSEQMRFPLYDYALDAKLPTADIRATGQAFTPRAVSLLDQADREGLTVRACGTLVAKSRSHGTFVGTVEQLADHMQLWLETGGCDGFNLMPAYFPDELDLFVDEAVPVLQRRGLFRREYSGSTLRGHLGLERPAVRR